MAALSNLSPSAEGDIAPKPVGTEFYRPPNGGSVSEKLDVYALGIIAFEMLSKFSTRSERAHALTQVRRGEFPSSTTEGEGGDRIKELLVGMLEVDEKERWGCDRVRTEIEQLVSYLKA